MIWPALILCIEGDVSAVGDLKKTGSSRDQSELLKTGWILVLVFVVFAIFLCSIVVAISRHGRIHTRKKTRQRKRDRTRRPETEMTRAPVDEEEEETATVEETGRVEEGGKKKEVGGQVEEKEGRQGDTKMGSPNVQVARGKDDGIDTPRQKMRGLALLSPLRAEQVVPRSK